MKKYFTLTMVAISVIFASCVDNTPNLKYQRLVLPMVSDYLSIVDTVDGLILVQQSRDSSYGDQSLNYLVTAQFVDITNGVIDAGTMTYNGLTVNEESNNYYSTPEVLYASGPTRNTTFNGSLDRFSLSGGTYFPAFTDSITSPNGPPIMITPYADTSVSRSSNLYVAWSGTRDTTCTIVISIRDTNGNAYSKVTTDNGSCTISSSELGIFPTNDRSVQIIIYKFKYNVITVSSKRVGIVELCHHTKHIWFTS